MKGQPAAKILLPYAAGLVAGHYLGSSWEILAVLFITAAFTITSFLAQKVRNSRKGFWLSIFCFIILGYLQHELQTGFFPAHHISNYVMADEPVSITGIINSYPEARAERDRVVLKPDSLESAHLQKISVTGKILITLPKSTVPLKYGDKIQITGSLQRPRGARNPGEFSYAGYLAAQSIFATMSVRNPDQIDCLSSGHGSWFFGKLVVPVKNYLEDVIERLPANQAALLKGLLIGERGEISADLRDNFSKLGVIHILAVSGLHVGFIVVAFVTFLGVMRVPYKTRVFVTISVLIFYAYLTNLKPSVIRAATMGSFILMGFAFERKSNFFNSVNLAALIILIFRPLDLFQSGFQLSFSAVISIVYLYPRFREGWPLRAIYARVKKLAPLRYVLDLALVSLAAFIGTLPLTALYFNKLPLFSLPANLLIIPLSFMALGNGLAAAAINFISGKLAAFYLATSELSLSLMIELAEFGSRLPFVNFPVYAFDITTTALYFFTLVTIMNLKNIKIRRWLLPLTLVLCNIWIWKTNFAFHDDLEVTFLDVGQGDAILLRFPGGRNALIDGGRRSPYFDTGRRVISPFLKREGISKIDVLILSHADSDHLGGFPYLMRHFEIAEVWHNGAEKETFLYREFVHLIDSLNIKHRVLQAGDFIDDFNPVSIHVVHPDQQFRDRLLSANDASLSLKITYGKIDFLFLGDIEKNGEQHVSRFGDILTSEVLKVSHHGSKTSSTPAFLQHVRPEIAVISVGERNKFGHPAAEVLSLLTASNAKILRTDLQRAIILRTDGQKLKKIFW